jgi:hypothetical protein
MEPAWARLPASTAPKFACGDVDHHSYLIDAAKRAMIAEDLEVAVELAGIR